MTLLWVFSRNEDFNSGDFNSGVTQNPSEITNIFNQYFASIGPRLARNISPSRINFQDYLVGTNHFKSFFFWGCGTMGLRHHVHVPRNLVAKIMKEIDPDGVEERRSRRLKRRTFSSKGAILTVFVFYFVNHSGVL